jgi:alkylation response protein AidB-like acyl-CoA dehydrogenase
MTAIENKHRTAEEATSVAFAEDNREMDWKSKSFMASLFMGDMDLAMAYPFPEQSPEDKAVGDEILAEINAFCEAHVDGEAIDKAEEIPAHVLKGFAELGLFAIKIPKKYGGLGLSQTNYGRILSAVTLYCASCSSTLSAHQSIGVPQPLKLFGTEEQKQKYLPKFAEGWISAFALTEPNAGSDPANMVTRAELSEDGTHWILNGRKLWCTNGNIADVSVVMARTPPKVVRGKEKKQISAFIVEMDSPGIDVLHRCRFMGIRAIENGIIDFTDVKVPVENLVGGEGNGLRLALTTLNDGRLGIPVIAAGGAQALADFLNRWAKTRVQWGKPIGKHEAGARKLAFVNSAAYAMDTMGAYGAALSDRGDVDIRMEAAAAKLFNTELGWEVTDTAMQLRAGRGFETAASLAARGEAGFPMERAMRDARINRIVEGTSDIMHLFLAREALDKHLATAGALFGRGSVGSKLMVILTKIVPFYATWYPKLWLGGLFKTYGGFDPRLKKHLKFAERNTRKMARTLFHQMATKGPKLEMRQLILARIVDLGAELMVMTLVASRVQTEMNRGDTSNVARALYWLDEARLRVARLFDDLRHNQDLASTALANGLIENATLLEAPEVELKPLPREYGKDLTSGRQALRLSKGGTVKEAPAVRSA